MPEILRLGTKRRPQPRRWASTGGDWLAAGPDAHVWSQTAWNRPRNLRL